MAETKETGKLLEGLRSGRTDVVEHVSEQISIIKKLNGSLKAFISVDEQGALGKARELQKKFSANEQVGSLAGLTIAVKDNICVRGLKCTASSRVLENYIAPYDASVIEFLRKEDAIIIGKTNMDEFAAGGSGTSGYFGPARNPFDIDRVPGGSSSGSAVALAAGMCDVALGSDTAGSIRCPASFCGLVGIRPSYGLVSRYGLLDLGMSMDTIGPFSSGVAGSALLLSAIARYDGRDETCLDVARQGYVLDENFEIEKIRIGIAKEFEENLEGDVSKIIKSSVKLLENKGARIVEVSLPASKYSVPIYYLTVFSEFASAMQKYDGFRYGSTSSVFSTLEETVSAAREESFGKEVKRRVLLGTYITMKEHKDRWYTLALRARSRIRKEFAEAFRKADVIAGATMPFLPWVYGKEVTDPLQNYMADVLTSQANLAGIPAGVVPAGVVPVKGCSLPVGLQFHAPALGEKVMLNLMHLFEKARGDIQPRLKLDPRLSKVS